MTCYLHNITVRRGALAFLLILGPFAVAWAQPPGAALPLWRFDEGLTNRWGGHYNAFSNEPSWTRTYLDSRVHLANSRHSLRVTVHREAEGFCGVWLEFYPAGESSRHFLDATLFRYLSFWVKGEKGGETFGVRLADGGSQGQGSGFSLPIQRYLPQGLATEWREVLIPLADFRGLDLQQLTQLALFFNARGDYRFYLDRLALKKEKDDAVPDLRAVRPRLRPSTPAQMKRALWVWNTEDLVASATRETAQAGFFRFCHEMGIRDIYLALDLERHDEPGDFRFTSRYGPEALKEFLARAHQQGFTVEALVGTPEWTAWERQREAQAAVLTVKDLNARLAKGARFDGVHFDVEPYLLAGYSSSTYQGQVLHYYLDMVAASAELARRETKLSFSCDVPAWFFPGEQEAQKWLMVSFRGKEQSLGEHLLDLMDAVTIMAYRNEADGAGGIISLAAPALRAAAAKGKKVIVGLETYSEPDAPVSFVCCAPADEFAGRLKATALQDLAAFQGYRLRTFSDGSWTHLGLGSHAGTPGGDAGLQRALISLVTQFNGSRAPDYSCSEAALDNARAAIAHSPEFSGFEPFELRDSTERQIVCGFRTVCRMARHTTFDGLGREGFEEEARSATEWLSGYPSFSGLAIHHYESFHVLMGK